MKERVPNTIYSKELHEHAVKQVTEEGFSPKKSSAAFVDVYFQIGILVKGRADRAVGRCRQDTTLAGQN